MKTMVMVTSIFVLSRTLTFHVWIAISSFLVVIVFLTTQKWLVDKLFPWGQLLVVFCLFLGISYSLFLRVDSSALQKLVTETTTDTYDGGSSFLLFSDHTSSFHGSIANSFSPNLFISRTGQITKLERAGRFVLETEKETYILRSSKKLEVGDIVQTTGKLQPASKPILHTTLDFTQLSLPVFFTGGFDYPGWLWMKGMDGDILASHLVILDHSKDLNIILSLRKQWWEMVRTSWGTGRASGLLQGMMIGDRSQIPPQDYEKFISSGLVHIVAVSGSNIMYVVLLFHALLFFLPYYLRIICILLSIIFYAMICGMDSSVIRAVVMGSLVLLALLGGRTLSTWRSIGMTWIGMLLRNPLLLLGDVGFLLSFGALSGIVRVVDQTKERASASRIAMFVRSYILPSLGAGWGTAPILIGWMGQVNILSILINIGLVPLVPAVLFRGVSAVVIDKIFPVEPYLDIIQFPFETIYWLSGRLVSHGRYVSFPVGRNRWVGASIILLIPFIGKYIWQLRKNRGGQSISIFTP